MITSLLYGPAGWRETLRYEPEGGHVARKKRPGFDITPVKRPRQLAECRRVEAALLLLRFQLRPARVERVYRLFRGL